jgi:hypothetical protein
MKHEELQSHLSRLVGAKIFDKFCVGNSIILWIDGPAKTPRAKCLWIDPPWRIESEHSITTTSASFPQDQEEDESDEMYKSRFTEASKASDIIEHSTIIGISVNPNNSDLTVVFNNGQTLRTFTVWTDDENWFFSNYETNEKFSVATSETSIRPIHA